MYESEAIKTGHSGHEWFAVVHYRDVSHAGADNDLTSLVPQTDVRHTEVSAIKHMRYRQVPLYS